MSRASLLLRQARLRKEWSAEPRPPWQRVREIYDELAAIHSELERTRAAARVPAPPGVWVRLDLGEGCCVADRYHWLPVLAFEDDVPVVRERWGTYPRPEGLVMGEYQAQRERAWHHLMCELEWWFAEAVADDVRVRWVSA